MNPSTAVRPLSERLRQKLDLFSSGLSADLERFWTSEDLPRRYPLLLQQLYTLSSGASPQMTRIAAYASSRTDEASKRFGAYMTRHVEEERGHWEWLLDDLAALGFDRVQEAQRKPTMWTASILGCGYVWALDHHPACYLGWLSVFEGNPPSVPFLDAVIERHGMPREGFSFMLDHAKVDLVHSADIHRQMDGLDLEPEVEQGLIMCALQVQSLSHELLRGVLDAPLF